MTIDVELIEAVGEHLNAEHDYKSTSRWFASGAGMCWRQRWYQATGQPRDTQPDAAGSIVMALGNYLHGIVQSGAFSGEGIEVEKAWRDELISLGGRADALITTPQFGIEAEDLPCVVEIKTLSDYGFRRSKEPEARHVLQAAQSAVTFDARSILIVYVSRENGRMHTWLLPVDDDLIGKAYAERRFIADLERAKVMPHRIIPGYGEVKDPMSSDAPWFCSYCGWRPTCAEARA